MSGFSIVMCTYNSEKKLPETIRHLKNLKIPDGYSVEFVFVDNGSTDQTLEIIREGQAFAPVRLLEEKRQGQVFARIKGVAEAQYEYVVFCDDDNWLAEDYLVQAARVLQGNKKIGAVGGFGEAVSEVAFPEWFSASQSIYACGPQAIKSGDVSKRGYLWGAGLVARKSALDQVYQPAYPMVSSGRTGDNLTSGDDVEMCLRILLSGYALWYEEKLKFQHALTSDKLTGDYRNRLIKGMVDFKPIKQQYFWELEKKKCRLDLMIFVKHIILFILLKMRLVKKQQYAIINPFRASKSQHASIRAYANRI